MKIKIIAETFISSKVQKVGTVCEVDASIARTLIDNFKAESYIVGAYSNTPLPAEQAEEKTEGKKGGKK